MSEVLSSAPLLQTFLRKGVVGPVTLFDSTQAATYLHILDGIYAGQLPGNTIQGEWRFQTHLFLPFVAEIIKHPALLEAVREVLQTDNILVWYTEWHIKEPSSTGVYRWHQDSTYAGLQPLDNVVTAWIALTEATVENGCVKFLPQPREEQKQLPHVEVPGDPSNLLLKGQYIPETMVDERKAMHIELQPGQATIHAFRTIHASGPNTSATSRRVGLAIRYMDSRVQPTGKLREGAVLVSGIDEYHHFDHRPLPSSNWDPSGLILHQQEMAVMETNYMEQEKKCGEHTSKIQENRHEFYPI